MAGKIKIKSHEFIPPKKYKGSGWGPGDVEGEFQQRKKAEIQVFRKSGLTSDYPPSTQPTVRTLQEPKRDDDKLLDGLGRGDEKFEKLKKKAKKRLKKKPSGLIPKEKEEEVIPTHQFITN
jgi:hypothetical protein